MTRQKEQPMQKAEWHGLRSENWKKVHCEGEDSDEV